MVLWLGGREVIAGRLTVGEFVAFNAYLAMLGWPMIAFGWVTNLLQRGSASWGGCSKCSTTPPDIVDGPRDDVPSAHRGHRVAAPDVRLRGGPPVLHDISLTVPAGATLAIVGPTGSGKSTLVGLLPRLFDPPPGTVFVDGIDVRDLPLGVLRGSVGMVPQEPFCSTTPSPATSRSGRPRTTRSRTSSTPWRWPASTSTSRRSRTGGRPRWASAA